MDGASLKGEKLISFETKAETLERLAPLVKCASILPQVRFTVSEWGAKSEFFRQQIREAGWFKKPLIVRSSAVREDREGHSMAGRYLSVFPVSGEEALKKAVARVAGSFGNASGDDQIFVQPFLERVRLNGVVFTLEPSGGGPYFVINYSRSGDTASVTGGASNNIQTCFIYKHSESVPNEDFKKVIGLAKELEQLFQNTALDIEFALTEEALYLLQVRPLRKPVSSAEETELRQAIENIHAKIKENHAPHPYLFGSKAIYGIMPDWNPAEIIGVRPRPLALSLYKALITDQIWAYQRDNYGYKNLRSFPLLISFYGLPYIDVRVSFNSFIPAEIKEPLAERLVNYYIDRLVESPSHHDKVEFDVIFSCYTLDLNEKLAGLEKYGFDAEDCRHLAESLRKLTNRIIHKESGLWKKDIEKINSLETRRATILASSLNPVSKIFWLLEDCKRYGTLPFAGLARAGFVAVQLLKSLISAGILTEEDYENFMGCLDSVSSRLAKDFNALERPDFLKRYGHLRPGTYDLLCPRYDESPESYFDWSKPRLGSKVSRRRFELSAEKIKKLINFCDSTNSTPSRLIYLISSNRPSKEGRSPNLFLLKI